MGHYINKLVVPNCQVHIILLKLDEEGSIWLYPGVILDTIEHQLCQCTILEVLIQWNDTQPKDATWEPTRILHQFSCL
jgi:hypothetical protein